jgi:NADH:ubiquinone oxidoreductase subunit D
MDYLAYYFNAMAFCGAVETLLGLEVPKRAQYLRVIHLELNRIMSHLVWLGTSALDLGAISMFWYCFRERETVLDLFEMSSGQRMHTRYIQVGGVFEDIPRGWEAKCRQFLDLMPDRVDQYGDLLNRNEIVLRRLRGTEALDGLPEGPHITDDRKVALPPRHELATSMEALIHHFKLVTEGFRVPPGEVYYPIEGPRGELACFVRSDGSSKPARVHMRDPSFVNLQATAPMVKDAYIADLIATLAMLDPILGGIDR